MPDPTKFTSPWPAYLVGILSSISGLALSQSLISNQVEKLVTGFASILIPFGFVVGAMIYHALHHVASARVQAAQITAGKTGLTK